MRDNRTDEHINAMLTAFNFKKIPSYLVHFLIYGILRMTNIDENINVT